METFARGASASDHVFGDGNIGDQWAVASALSRVSGPGGQATEPPPSTDYKSKIDAVETGVNQALARVEALLSTEAFAENLPFIGPQLKSAYDAGTSAVQTITGLKTAIVGALDAVSNIGDLSTKTATEVHDLIQTTLTNQLNALGAGYVGLVTTSAIANDGTFSLVFDTGRSIALDINPGSLGLDGLNLAVSGNAQAQLAWNFDFKVGIDGGGFYLDTSQSALSLGATVDLSPAAGNFSAEANLGFLHFSATNIDDAASGTADTLNLTLATSWNAPGKIYAAGLSNDILNVGASGNLDLDLHLAGDMGNAVLPKIGADLHVNWAFNQNILNGTGANTFGAATIVFDHVKYDLGSFVHDFVTPILEKLDPILAPINQALSVLRTELTFLPQDWQNLIDVTGNLDGSADGKATVLDLIKLARPDIDMGPIATLIDTVDKVVDFVEFFRGRDFSDAGYDLGSYSTVIGDIQNAANSLSGLSIDPANFTANTQSVTSFLAGLTGAGFGDVYSGSQDDFAGKDGADLFGSLLDSNILQFPILENPINAIKLLFGQNTDLFKLDLPAINLSAGFDANGNVTSPIPILPLPIWPLPLVQGQIGVAFQAIIDLAFGYDTTGLLDYRNGGFTDPSQVFNGFYLDDQRANGVDIPEIILRAAVDIAVDANLGIVSVGGGGNIIGEVALDFADSLFGPDGRLYLNELTFNLASNPFGLFDVEGRITAGLRAYVNTPFGTLWRYNSDRLTLADFSFVQGAEPAGPPPGLADQSGGDLILNIGARAGERDIADKSDGAERVEITTQGGHLLVSAFSTGQIFNEDGSVTRIVGDGGAYDDEILLDKSVAVAAVLSGGVGSDTLGGGMASDTLAGGNDNDWLLGRAGGDTLNGDDGDDYLDGGAGGDAIDGGAGFDTATYVSYNPASGKTGITLNLTNAALNTADAAGDTFTGVEIFEGSKYNDTFTGTAGTDVFSGIEGDDKLNGEGGNDILVGGLGADRLNGGDGYDIASYYLSATGVTITMNGTSGTGVGGEAEGDVLTGIEEVDGSNASDHLIGGNGSQVFYGEGGADTLDGGAADDVLNGGEGADTLIGGEGYDYASYDLATLGVTLSLTTGTGTAGEALGDTLTGIENVIGSAHADIITGDGNGNILLGGDGDDTLSGAGGMDVLEGGAGADAMDGGADRDMASYAHAAAGITLDLVNGTRDGDAIGDTFQNIEIYGGTQFADFIRGTDAGEEIRGEAGADTLYGAGGDDTILGGAGDDMLDGEAGNDVLHGGAGNDRFNGGTDRDRVTYFDSTAGVRVNLSGGTQTFGATTLAAFSALDGLGGTDTFLATIATNHSSVEDATGSTFTDFIVASEDGSILVGLGGNDQLRGLGGADTLNGGVGDDKLDGGAGSSDVATYIDDTAGVVASLTTRVATQGAGAGTDTLIGIEGLTGSGFADTLTGDGGVNRLTGGAGDDILDGLAGADVMDGGTGNDIFFVDNAGDVVTDTGGDSADMIKASINYSLAGLPAIEQLQLLGTATTGTGNASSNLLIGNANANVLDGGGNGEGDTFWGYEGDDLYIFDSLGDTIGTTSAPRSGIIGAGENATGGIDEIRLKTTAIYGGTFQNPTVYTYSLDRADLQRIENLSLVDNDRAVNLTGNALANTLVGNTQNQTIDGGTGNDTLDPGRGRDTVIGGVGIDTLRIDWSNVDYGLTTNLDGSGTYTGIIYWAPSSGDANHYRVDFNGIERFEVTTGSGADDIRSGDADDIIKTGAGNDILRTGIGADIVIGGDEADGARGLDTWVADKSAATQAMTIDLTVNTASSYVIGNRTGTVAGIEALGADTGTQKFSSGSGADLITTMDAGYNDYIATNGGNDRVIVAGGRDWVDMGAGIDTLVVNWSDLDYGQTTNFAVASGGGYDGIYFWGPSSGDANHDRVDFFGVEHFDITTGSGDDYIRTGDGNDRVTGGAGNDYLVTGKGIDIVVGGAGDDRWEADKSDATAAQSVSVNLRTTGIQSTYFGTGTVSGIDMLTLTTGAASDVIVTLNARFDDVINTGLGADTVTIAGGRDTITLGGQPAGTIDTLIVDWSDLAYGQTTAFGGSYAAGYDGIYFWGPSSGDGDHDRVDFFGVERFDVTTGSGGDDIRTGDYDDAVRTGAGNDILRTGKGADIVVGGSETDGTRGVDTWVTDKSDATAGMTIDLTVNTASSYVIAGRTGTVTGVEVLGLDTGTEKFASGSGNDVITTMDARYNDYIATNGGNDTVTVAGGRDWIDMGAGTDTLVVNWSDIDYDQTTSIGAATAGGYDGYYFWGPSIGDGDHDLVNFYGVEQFDLTLGSGNDVIRTGDGNDRVSGGAGNDVIATGKGIDVVVGGTGNDRWEADKSAATASQAVSVNLRSTGMQSTYFGTGTVSGIDMLTLTTGAGNDVIVTLDARFDDIVTTGLGADSVTVAGGRDTVALGGQTAGTIDTLVVDWSDLIYGQSTYQFTLSADGYSGVFAWAPSTGDADHDRVDFSGVERFDLTLGSGADDITTGDFNDAVRGGAGNDILRTGKGADAVVGGSEANGDRGVDTWVADKSEATVGMTIDLTRNGASSYIIAGITGSVTGIEVLGIDQGAGRFSSGSGADIITTMDARYNDFIATNGGDDRVTVAGGRDWIDLGTGSDTLVVDWSDLAYGQSTNLATAGAGTGYDGIFFWGPSSGDADHDRVDFFGVENFDVKVGIGNDTIVTGNGNDRVDGGAGDDSLSTGSGTDIVIGGAGNDRWTADKSAATASQAISVDLRSAGVQSTYFGTGSVTGFEMLTLTTGAGNDVIVTLNARFDDVLLTGSGADSVTIAGGRDTVALGGQASGTADLLVVDWSDNEYGMTTSLSAKLATGYDGVFYWAPSSGDADHDRVDFSGVERFDLSLGSAGDSVATGDGDDRIRGGGGNDYLNGGGGTDTVDYGDKTAGIVVLLNGATETQVTVGGTVEDTILNFEDVIGGSGDDTISGDAKANILDGGAGTDTLSYAGGNKAITVSLAILTAQDTGGAGTDTILGFENLIGSSKADTLTGSAADNRIDGGAGNDTMTGGGGNDTYVVDTIGDMIVELAGGGTADLVESSVTFSLAAQIENLTLTGTAAIDATGNDLANILIGNAGANILNGGVGADRMTGGDGNDTYVVDAAGDTVSETSTTGGVDTVQSAVTYTFGANLENLMLTGSAAINGTGNTLANVIIGNDAANRLTGDAGADTLDGGGGADILTGGNDNDTYIVDDIGDRVIEAKGAAGGIDLVRSSVSFTLSNYVENLTLTGSADIDGTGNKVANVIIGNASANRLDGAAGDDSLYGGLGNDTLKGGTGQDGFYFDAPLSAAQNMDTILDFSVRDDTIFLDRAVFTRITTDGILSADAFNLGTAATERDDRIIYDAAAGHIFYDSDGTGATAAILFATVTPGAALTNLDFSAFAI